MKRRVPILGKFAAVVFLTISVAFPRAVSAEPKAAVADPVERFHQSRSGQSLWFGRSSGTAAEQLLNLLGTAELDGISKNRFQLGSILVAIRKASSGDPAAVNNADLILSKAFVAYAQELQRDPKVGVIYVDRELKPTPSSAAVLLESAANATSLDEHIRELRWMNPLYGQLRQALLKRTYATPQERHVLLLNLERVRALPPADRRYVLINTANQKLYMYENEKLVDEMNVVAGRANAQTPLMSAYIRFAVLNPYWNVPSDLTARLAPNVLKRGHDYLRQQGYQLVSDFSDDPKILDPTKINWKDVAAGKMQVHLRQLPGPANSMGRVKFMFPNSQGVWLHDSPNRELFKKAVRLESAGCIRLEDAWRLGSWLFQRPLSQTTGSPEQQLELPEPVPVYITYLTAVPEDSEVVYVNDPYKRNLPPLQAS